MTCDICKSSTNNNTTPCCGCVKEKEIVERKPSQCCSCDCPPAPDCTPRLKPIIDPFARDGPYPNNKKCAPVVPKPVKCVPCAVDFACPFVPVQCPKVAAKPVVRVPCEVRCWQHPCISVKPKEIAPINPPRVSCAVSATMPFPCSCKAPEIRPICPPKVGCPVPCAKPHPGNCDPPEIQPICPPAVSCPVPATFPCQPCAPIRGCTITPYTPPKCYGRTVEAASHVSNINCANSCGTCPAPGNGCGTYVLPAPQRSCGC